MKSFVASLLIFLSLLFFMIWNYQYIHRTCDELERQIGALPSCGEAGPALDVLCEFWDTQKSKIELSVPGSELDRFETQLTELIVANEEQEEKDFNKSKVLLLEACRRLRRLERLEFANLLQKRATAMLPWLFFIKSYSHQTLYSA